MRTLRSESQITSDWKLGVDSPVVSICCVTYNHERFVEDALEGFLKQETDFPFEILIYDDASTDKTADVVREYERKYPRIIKPIYQEENQFSRGVGVSSTYNFPRARGKYIALCEGDDYWLDAHKLKKQVDVFSLYEDASMVFHHSYVLRGHLIRKKKLQTFFSEVRKVSDKKVILDLGCFYGTATSMFRKDVIDLSVSLFEGAEKLSNKFSMPVPGDYILSTAAIMSGSIYCMNTYDAVYRKHPRGITQQYKAHSGDEGFEKRGKLYKRRIATIDYLKEVDDSRCYYYTKLREIRAVEWLSSNVLYIPFLQCIDVMRNGRVKLSKHAILMFYVHTIKNLLLKWRK